MRASMFFAAFVLVACTGSEPHSVFIAVVHVQPRKYYFVDNAAPSQAVLQRAVDLAIAGDDAKLAYVISLVRYTDGEGAENFGKLLNQLRDGVKPSRFQRALRSLPLDVRQNAVACMQAAEKLDAAARSVRT
jgi:hypothetical protein